MEKDREIRSINGEFVADDSKMVIGKAICFESPSNDMGFIETIKRGAITQELLDNSDVFARMNHSDDYILARSKKGKGSLTLELRDDGVYYSFEAPNTEKGNELLEHIKRGEITTSSFAFRVANEDNAERWYKTEDGVIHRDINKIDYLGDIAPVFSEAYSETFCSLRGEDMVKTSHEIDSKMDLLKKELEAL